MKLNLSKLPWYNRDDVWVTGFILSGESYLKDEALLKYFSGASTLPAFEEKLKSANGQFSVIIKREEEVWAATDRLRHWPLFYTRSGGENILGDDCNELAMMLRVDQFDPVSVDSFLSAGYVINNLTLVKNIFQVEAGSYVSLGNTVSSKFYHNTADEPVINRDLHSGAIELSGLLHEVFRNHLTGLNDRFIAIPLSGGYDSRLVAAMTSRYHPENILCYTYGRRDNPEVALARESARRLGLKWINIVYDSELIQGFIQDGYFESYYPYVSDLNSMFFLQEYFAVRYLKQNNLIPQNSVFISGYSGDFIAGSYLTPAMKKPLNRKSISELIFREYFRMVDLSGKRRSAVCERLGEKIPSGISDTSKVIESWDMKERHAKFIINSAKVFTFFGYEYVFPLWDNRLVDYMMNLPFILRNDRKLYEFTLRNKIFSENDLNLTREVNPSPLQKTFQRFKERVKPLLPRKIRNIFIDPENQIFYDEITRILRDEIDPDLLKTPRQPNYYNSYIIQWYLMKTAEMLNIKTTR